jgi:Ca2+-binding RTX toxin-like protein
VIAGTTDIAGGESINGGTGTTDTIQVTSTTDFAGATIGNIDVVTLADGITATFTGAQVTGQTWTVSGISGGSAEALIVNAAAGGAVTLASVTTTNATVTLNGSTGNETLTGTAGVDTINGGAGADSMTGGNAADIFLFSNSATSTPSDSNFDIITDFAGGTDKIDFGATSIVKFATAVSSAAGTAGVATSTGVVTFNAADDTLAERITAVASALGSAVAGNALLFQLSSDSYIYITDGTAGVGSTDVLIKLVGISGNNDNELTITSGDITDMT